jgi:hypothetical protein
MQQTKSGGIRARIEARAAGYKIYRGCACKRGHSGIRYTSTGGCIECITGRRWRDPAQLHREDIR